MVQVVVEGWFLGLSTGPYCLGACAPFLIPYLFAAGRTTWAGNLRLVGEFLLGRLLAYLCFGLLVGWLGGMIQPHLTQRIASLALGVTAALMLCYAIAPHLPPWRVCLGISRRLRVLRIPLVLGWLIGINVCPPFVAGVARLLQLGAMGSSVAFFLSFFAGTTLYTLPLIGLSPLARLERWQRIGRLCALLIGTWFLLSALR